MTERARRLVRLITQTVAIVTSLSTGSAQCDTVQEHIFINTPSSTSFFIGDALDIPCDNKLRYVVDFDFFDEADIAQIVEIYDGNDAVVFTSEPIGINGTFQGFFIYHVKRNGDESIDWLAKYPQDFTFQEGSRSGKWRLIFDYDSRDLWVRINGGRYSLARWRVYCKKENRLVRIDTVNLCREPIQARETVIATNCDTIHIDSVNRALEGLESVDTVYIESNQLLPGTYVDSWTTNGYECPIPWRVRIVRPHPVSVYVPNVVGRNMYFELSRPVYMYRIFDRSGAVVHEYPGDGSLWRPRAPGVYVIYIDIDPNVTGEEFCRDITVLR